MRNRFVVCAIVALAAEGTVAETVILKDGTFVEGKVVRETSRMVRIETRSGSQWFPKKDIDQIIQTYDTADIDVNEFAELPPEVRAVLNAKADYKLKHYDKALARLSAYRNDRKNPAIAVQIDWMVIELYERLGRWDEVKKLLQDKVEHGMPREQIRAQAHLDILKQNPGYDLRFVGERNARNFLISADLRMRRETGSLRDADVMRAALEEYCEQLLVKDKLSVKAFADRLDVQKTYEALTSDAARRGNIENLLPYAEDLRKAESSLYKAQSVLGDYGAAFRLDLIRTELTHLLAVADRMLTELLNASPDQFSPAVDAAGRLTPDGRREWRRRCDEFVDKARPVQVLLDYAAEKAERYPRDLKQLHDVVHDLKERIDQDVKSVRRQRDRVHE